MEKTIDEKTYVSVPEEFKNSCLCCEGVKNTFELCSKLQGETVCKDWIWKLKENKDENLV